MVINPHNGDQKIIINDVIIEYVSNNKFVEYLRVPMGSKRISKIKFIEATVQKVLEELDQVEYNGLALNQVIRIIRCYILNKLYYAFANMDILKKYLTVIDQKVRNIINRFIKWHGLQNVTFMGKLKMVI
jgi:hypothetical protein